MDNCDKDGEFLVLLGVGCFLVCFMYFGEMLNVVDIVDSCILYECVKDI